MELALFHEQVAEVLKDLRHVRMQASGRAFRDFERSPVKRFGFRIPVEHPLELREIVQCGRHARVLRTAQFFLLREDARLSFPQIGQLLGGRDHSSVVHACEKIALEIERDGKTRLDARALRDLLP